MVKKIASSKDRLIVALDFDDIMAAKAMVENLSDEVTFYKVGLELSMSKDYFELINWLSQRGKKVFADLKLFDISATVGKAIKNLSKYPNIDFVTIHSASRDIMSQAFINKGHIKILAVTVLTNLDSGDLKDMGFDDRISLQDLVVKKAKLAKDCNIDGVVSSGQEAQIIRKNTSDDFLIVTPGIRPDFLNNDADDQKRVVDVKTAFLNGSDYIVVGRPITKNTNPKRVASKIQEQISELF
jgi:orotidine-5'-phosphate decarboxylase